ncbi:MAG: hypothetical protein U0531_00175 [Dehalococcoidia bacterium]
MTPGLALFYGGMVRSKNVLNMLMKNFFTISIVTVIWVLVGFSLAFGADIGGGIIGNLSFAGLNGIMGDTLWPATTIPASVFMAFQLMFAIITPALITGAVAERMKFSAWVIFSTLWSLIVYSLVAHWAFAADGWIFKLGARDFIEAASSCISTPASRRSPASSPSVRARDSVASRSGRIRCR